MRKAIFYRFLAISITSLLIASLIFSYFISEYNLEQTEKNMTYSIELIDYGLDYSKDLQEQTDKIKPIMSQKNTRITIVDKDGNVFADSSDMVEFFDDHSHRPEIIDAFEKGNGINVRYSESLKQEMFYVAKTSQKSDYIIRLSIPYHGKTMFLNALIPSIITSIIIAFAFAFLLAKRFSETITEPLNKISKELLKVQIERKTLDFKEYKYDEINNIMKSVKILSERIENTVDNLNSEKNKINYILDNMQEGIIVVDEKENLLLANKAATKALDGNVGIESKKLIHFTQNIKIIEAVENVIKNNTECIFDINDKNKNIFRVHVSKTKKGVLENTADGVIIFMIDVTTERETQRFRQEFFSNVSHELKTPITSIQGYAELLNSGILYDTEQKVEFLNRIQTETKNMTNLINDILMISKLESGVEKKDFSDINIKNIIEEILSTNRPVIDKNKINVSVECDDCIYNANYSQIYQLLNNIIINAIKYNKEYGNVSIRVNSDKNNIHIKVYDTGIGIPADSIPRVFERFYRVDKGRSKKMGGTGLGLSIVKHIVNFYSGTINLTSKVGTGTKIDISLPIQKSETN